MKQQLSQKIGLEVLENEPLAKYTTFKIGGPAKFLVKVNNKIDLYKAVKAARELKLSFFILGGGSNVLVSDNGYDGLVIKLDEGQTEFSTSSAKVFAGNSWSGFIRDSVKHGLGGLEFGANIPGTVGGAVYGNAGAYGQGAGDYVDRVEIIDVEGEEVSLIVLSKEECEFAYRESLFKKNKHWIIAEVVFRLIADTNAAEKLEQIEDEWNKRMCSQPLNLPSAGCSFKNLLYTPELEKYKDWEIKGKLPAAKFIEELELKGKKIGGAMISDVHANFIVNFDNATADNVMQLISLVKTKVRDKFGVQLEEEVQYVGF
ncbi:UDP-N-acetylmuramate dehydrogenase [Candidatus Falkowbacteria bacterium]|jgi:UDP-N-acetylmuramate dehydrogenase|nr:UDP-N-acetylmuramate dehydrogenase [Candidatus Falkowbacteria bacterium]MBT5503246.1 UDP-N-acetylmuramate dehydrogenase [Candidatus Falkowbacteria bacterium]MBT6574245.1 UDP-N-acetylmuramate dehydrogenase [Candidatus Falkowbacteria bacterium]MBT7348149.1 UDP-N-acetylmuramate dehydrogenase [Candidatus Falkowbacteria bacterium]MBT7500790.1 UDP-N-acetylmuramate dehydrogenase [Candidatus Falkowbacteria bacterium]